MRGTRTAAAVMTVATLSGAALLLSSCTDDSGTGQPSAPVSVDERADQSDDLAQGAAALPTPESSDGSGAAVQPGALDGVTVERKVIATAEVTLRSHDVPTTIDALESITTAADGYVSARDVQNDPDDPDRTRATIVIRVPTAQLDAVIDDIQAEGDVVRAVSSQQDVTQTVVDVDSRVASARASVERIRALLSEANTIGDVVRIESELSRREADLESLLAQQRALADQTAMATVSVTVLAPEVATPAPGHEEQGFVAGLERGWNALVGLVVVALTALGVLLPFVVVGALVLVPVLLAWRNRHGRHGVAGPPSTPQPDATG